MLLSICLFFQSPVKGDAAVEEMPEEENNDGTEAGPDAEQTEEKGDDENDEDDDDDEDSDDDVQITIGDIKTNSYECAHSDTRFDRT